MRVPSVMRALEYHLIFEDIQYSTTKNYFSATLAIK